MVHTIQRQYLHLDLQGSEAEGFALQNRLPEFCGQALYRAMEQVFDRCAPATGRLRIERLEVDAGTLRLERLEQDLPELVAQALEKALLEQMPPGEAQSPESVASANALLKDERQIALEAFIYFLENGRLPWSFRLPPGIGLEQFLLGFWEKEPITPSAVSQIAQVLRSPHARRRLVMQFSEPFLEMLLQNVSAQAHASVSRIRAALRDTSGSTYHLSLITAILPVIEKRLWEAAFAQTATADNTEVIAIIASVLASLPEAVAPVLPLLKDIVGPSLPAFVRLLKEYAGADFPVMAPQIEAQLKAVFGPLLPEIQTLLNTKTSAPLNQEITSPAVSVPGQSKQKPPAAHTDAAIEDPASAPEESIADQPLPNADSLSEEGIYVDNAGLVILHPFLQMFFEGLGIARDGVLLQPDRALHLLHFLCTGQTPAPEYELALPKILCNIPLETPVEADITLTDQEKDEAENLLRAAIRWWEALRNTSPDALRGTFLCRPGKVSRRDDGDWLLQVERQSFDVLLDQLPWGISAVKLPWMEGVVWVEWN